VRIAASLDSRIAASFFDMMMSGVSSFFKCLETYALSGARVGAVLKAEAFHAATTPSRRAAPPSFTHRDKNRRDEKGEKGLLAEGQLAVTLRDCFSIHLYPFSSDEGQEIVPSFCPLLLHKPTCVVL
jgi:hypothetical protein